MFLTLFLLNAIITKYLNQIWIICVKNLEAGHSCYMDFILKLMKITKIYSACLLVVFFSSHSQADKPKKNINQFDNKSIDSNLAKTNFKVISSPNSPSKITRNIKHDKKGNLLIAAFKDIIQFDGKSFIKFQKMEGLDSYQAFDVLEDTKGNIWIASTHHGVFRYDGEVFSNFTVKDGLTSDRVMSIYEDKAGGIWIATQAGLSFYNRKSLLNESVSFQNFTTKDGLTSNDINTVIEDRTGKLWVGTRGTLNVYEPLSLPKSDAKVFTEIKDNEGKPFANVWSIIEDQKGNIWLADARGLWRFKNNSFTFFTTTAKIERLYEDKKGKLWFTHSIIGSQNYGLSYYDQNSLLNESPKAILVHVSASMLFGISEDKEGSIWVGTLNGVFRYDGESVNYFRDEPEPEPGS